MLRLFLVRHGQTAWNVEGKQQGYSDIPLDANGVLQAQQTAFRFSNELLTAVYSSDSARSLVTAETIASQHKTEICVDKRLRERNYGEWEGKSQDELRSQHKEAYQEYVSDPVLYCPTGGESGIDLFMRVSYFLSDLLEQHQNGSVVIVGHGGSLSVLLASLLNGTPATGMCFRLHNCSITESIVRTDGRRFLIHFNDISHLNPAPQLNLPPYLL